MPSPSLSSRLAVCVWMPLFALRVEERRHPDLVGRPTALLSPDDSRRLWQVSSHARRAGVQPGHTVSQAIGLCGGLTLLEPDPVHYDETFSRLVAALHNVSPVVEPGDSLGRIYVGVDGLTRLLGTPPDVLETIDRTLHGAWPARRRWRRDIRSAEGRDARSRSTRRPSPGPAPARVPVWRMGWAAGKFPAWVAATIAKPGAPLVVDDEEVLPFLHRQRIGAVPLSPDNHRRLWQLGVRTLRDFVRLPESAVVTQFGREGGLAWRLAAGRLIEPVVGSVAPAPIVATMDFPSPIADQQILGHVAEQLIDRALRHPRRQGWRVRTLRLRAGLEHGASWLVAATLKDPSASRASLLAPLLVKLDQHPPTGGVGHLAVEFTAFVRGTKELQLFARDADAAARAGRHRAIRWAAREIKTRLRQSLLHHIVEVHPWSRLPERRYALVDYDP